MCYLNLIIVLLIIFHKSGEFSFINIKYNFTNKYDKFVRLLV